MLLEASDIERIYKLHKITFYKNGIVVERKNRFPVERHPPTERKGVYEMSQKSKLRLTHIVANSPVRMSSMFTLTFGDFFIPFDGKELKRQTNVFLTRLRKRFAGEYLWFLEFTEKGRPHLHVLTTIEPNGFDRMWLGHTWSDISVTRYVKRLTEDQVLSIAIREKPFDEWVVEEERRKVMRVHAHKKNWELIRKPDGATRYCLKYALKQEQKLVPIGFQNVGRFWGTSHRLKPIPIGELIIGETMSEEQVKAVLLDTRIGQYALVPKYVFEQDAMAYFTSRGLKLTEIFDENGNHQRIQNE